MLDPTQLQAVAQAHGLTVSNAQPTQPATSGGSNVPSAADAYAKRVGYTPTQQTPEATQDIADQASGGASKFMEGVKEASPAGGGGLGGLVGGVGKILGGATEVVTSPLAPLVKPLGDAVGAIGDKIGDSKFLQEAVGPLSVPKVQPNGKILTLTEDNPSKVGDNISSVAETVGNYDEAAGLVAGGVAGADVAPKIVANAPKVAGDVAGTIKAGVKAGTQAVKNAVKPAVTPLDTIKAVDPGLRGKAGVSAYRQVMTGGRSVSSRAGWISEQTLTPSAQAARIGQRLYDSGTQLGKNPVKNLETIATDFQNTETKIDTAFNSGDPEVSYNADKPTLAQSLEDVRTAAPRETATIKDSSTMFNSVVDFAQQLLGKAQDTPKGIRTMRIRFDNEARREYPNAFKNGAINTGTPAGQAIAQVRDTINEHLYNTAPQGSAIRALIQHESDLYRANDAIAPEAFSTHGTTLPTQLVSYIKAHPYVSLFTAYEAIKHTVAPALPGL